MSTHENEKCRNLTPTLVEQAVAQDDLDRAIVAHVDGRDPMLLPDPVRALYPVIVFDNWVSNGGFYGFFFQIGLDPELVATGFERLGESECAALVREAVQRIRAGLGDGTLAGRIGALTVLAGSDGESDRILTALFRDLDAGYWRLLRGQGRTRRSAWALANLDAFAG